MTVLHASEEDGFLLFWGESDVQPFLASGSALERALQPWASERLTGLAWERQIALPAASGRPVPSTPRLGETPEGEVALARFSLSAIPLDTVEALRLLAAVPESEGDPLAPDLWPGQSLCALAALARFARALVVRQQVVPTVVREEAGRAARWKAALLGEDAARLAMLARALPGAVRALAPDGGGRAEESVRRALDRFVDALVRGGGSRPSRRKTFDSPHEALLHALQSDDGSLATLVTEAEASALSDAVARWEAPLKRLQAAPLRLCFRLEEPGPTANLAPWQVRFLLQPVADPSQLVDARDIWKGLASGREFLLQALGEAARLCPEVAAVLKKKDPGGFSIPTDKVIYFLTNYVPLLQSAGFVLVLPAWWAGKRPRLAVSASAKLKSKFKTGAGLTLDALVQFEATLTLDGEPLTDEERERLVRSKATLVRLRGTWVQLDAEGLARARALWQKSGSGKLTVGDLVRLTLGAETLPGGLPLGKISGEGDLGALLERLTGERPLEPTPTPKNFVGTLRPYQERGFAWLKFLTDLGLGACLADDMGLGKTAQTIALLLTGARPCLLVCPTSVLGNWEQELSRFAPSLRVLTQHGPARLKGEALASSLDSADVLLTSYALLHRDSEELAKLTFAGMVLDEAQNIKNPESRQSRAARTLSAGWRIALTGTPVENHVGDLWALFAYLNPGLLGSEREFKRQFFQPIQHERDEDAVNALKQRVGPLILRRLKTDKTVIADLPDKIEQEESCPLTPEQATLYEAVLQELSSGLDAAGEGMARRGLVLATLTRLKQVCNHPAHYLDDGSPLPERSGKLARLEELVESLLDSGESALIFTQFAAMGKRLAEHLRRNFGREALFLSGETTKKQRDALVERFQSEGGPPLFVLSLKAGGVGLNLTRASRVIHFDRWWNPAVEDQATDRAFRIGQRRNVFVHKFVCRGTVEERIAALIADKRDVAGQVIGAGEGWLTELSTNDLKSLFALSRERALREEGEA